MTGININFSPNEYEYSYNPSSTTGTNIHNTVNVYPKGDAGNKDYFINISSKSKNATATGNMPFDLPKGKAGIGKKIWKGFKYAMGGVRPGQVMMLGMMAFILVARSTPPSTSGGGAKSQSVEQAYKMGEQHIRDSIKTAHLEEQLKLAQDSLKLLKKMPK